MRCIIAGHIIDVILDGNPNESYLLRSYLPFATTDIQQEPILIVTVNDDVAYFIEEQTRLVRDVDTGNGMVQVLRHVVDGHDEEYQFVIQSLDGTLAAKMIADADFTKCRCSLYGDCYQQSYGLNSIIMMAFAFSVSRFDTILVHASMVRHDGRAFAFTAKSGTGKSTQVANWLKNIPHCDLMNDDNPVFRIIDGKVIAYGSPWSGKTPCYRQVSAPLGGIATIVRDTTNHIERQNVMEAFTALLTSCSSMKWDVDIYKRFTSIIGKMIGLVPYYKLSCLPDAESAIIACNEMARKI